MLHLKESHELDDYLSVESKFNRFLNYLSSLICPQKCQIQFKEDHFCYRNKWENHNKGALVRIFSDGPSIDRDIIKMWAKDTEHGLLHGIIVAFFAMLNKYEEIPNKVLLEQTSEKINTPITYDEKLVASCILHDFLKTYCKEEPHDKLLENLFFSLTKETYEHSNPTEISDLVIGDRWELLRYKDYESWVDFNLLFFSSEKQRKEIVCFEKYLRPAIEKLFLGVDDIWLRHSPEKIWANNKFKNLTSEDLYPPKGYWEARQDNSDFYAVEIGTIPPRGCLLHGYAKNNSLTDDDPASYSPYGLISLSNAKKYYNNNNNMPMFSPCVRVDKDTDLPTKEVWNSQRHLGDDWKEVIKTNGYTNNTFISREHLAVQSKVPLKEWLFLYDDNRNIPKLASKGRKKIERDWVLFKNSSGVINLHIATNLLELAKQIETILICIKT